MPESLRLPGLARPVRVTRDRFGMSHIVGERRADVYRALGWSMAAERLWQMDLMRRLALGRVAEILGRPFLVLDAIARTIGFPAGAGRAADTLTGDAAEALVAFTEGVSARIATTPPGPEFDLLGYVPEPWGVIDSLAIEFFVGFNLGLESLEPKLMLARALGQLGAERGAWLYPCPLPGALMTAERLAAYRSLEPGILDALAVLVPPPAGGSNAWAVAPRRSASGALVAGDPHLLHTAPSPWYLTHLVAAGLDVAGAAYVGGPVVQVGRNSHGAWSVTNLTADDADLVLERVDPDDPGRYATETGAWEPMVEREEQVVVRGEEPHRLVVRATRHGPLVNGIAELAGTPPGAPVALKWKAMVAPGHSLAGWVAVNASRGLADVLEAAPAFDGAPFQTNLVYGDVEGHIAHLAVGAVPRRHPFVPGLGWHGEGAWEGIGSLGSTRWRVDPADGAVWSANERTGAADRAAAGDGQPFGEHPARARRIRDVLLGGTAHTVAQFAALQVDELDLAAAGNLPALRDALADWEPADAVVRRACALLLAWDGGASAESPAAAFYHVLFYAEWLPMLLPEERCPGLARRWRIATWAGEAVLRAPRSPWFEDAAAKADALRGCAERAAARLRALAGADPDGWRWGALHQVRLSHPLAFAPRFAAGALPPFPYGGSPFAVNQQRFAAATPPFGAVVGAGVRMVVDLADPRHLHITLTTGQAGDPESPHFADHLPRWRAGELACVALDLARVEREEETVLAS